MAEEEIKRVQGVGDDYYKILGLGKGAGDDEIKKAYRKLALKLHPDKCQERGAEEAFKKVGEAFGVLSDSSKRQQYDQFGPDAFRGGGGGGGGAGAMSPEDLFEAFFAGAGGGHPFGRAAGGPRVVFSSGGMGGSTFHFSTMGGGPGFGSFGGGGPQLRQRRAGGGPQRQREAGDDEGQGQEAPVPGWAHALQGVASNLGPLLPLVVFAFMIMGMTVLSVIFRAVMRNAILVIPVMYLTEGKVKLFALGAIAVLSLAGVI